ncbi:Gfo/Idh/MocA family oxidoreductase [Candidatus Uhrbacteria bacterium]|nr:Gfo/Idh/MocA family oxidoreductase [Candidatus Uhrbacteria bacterium]
MKYKAALIGCGKIGAGVERYSAKIQPWAHASVFSQNERTELVGLMDNMADKKEKLSKDFPGVPFFTDVDEMMKRVQPEIVSIATLPESHAEIVEKVLAYPVKAILCEKPIAHSLEAAERLVAACKAKNVPLFINHIRRFDPEIRTAKKRLSEMGEVMQAHSYYTRGIHNNGTHVLDLLRFFLGDIVSVVGVRNQKTENYSDLPGEMNIDGLLTFASGAQAAIQTINSDAYSIFDFDFLAKGGKVALRHFGFRVEDMGTKPCSAFVGHKELVDEAPHSSGQVRSFMAPVVTHIVDCLEGRDTPVSTGEDGIAALKAIEAMIKSVNEGGRVVMI